MSISITGNTNNSLYGASRVNPYASAAMGTELINLSSSQFGLDSRPLSDDEVKLANDYAAYKEFCALSMQMFRSGFIPGTENKYKMSEELRENIRLRKENNLNQFDNVFAAMGFQKIDVVIFDPSTVTHSSNSDIPTYTNYDVDVKGNFVDIAVGSVINLGDYSLRVTRNGVEVVQDKSVGDNTGADEAAQALSNILYAASNGNITFGKTDLNSKAISILQNMGIDTNKNFRINNQLFEVDDGVLERADYNPQEKPYGSHYLNVLLSKAYEQNMVYEDSPEQYVAANI